MHLLVLWFAATSLADVVGPDATGCPRGSVGTSNHGGAYCTPAPECSAECQAGERCESVGLCVLEEERSCGGMIDPKYPCTYTHREALRTCRDQSDCATGTCEIAERCVAAGCGGCASPMGGAGWLLVGLVPLLARRRRSSRGMGSPLAWVLAATAMTGCGGPCEEGGETYAAGESWECADGCNTCTCSGGAVVSTRLACVDPCETCLATGGTWQPEIEECTKDCAVQDISCFDEACPAE